jgi:hypothetical protein
MLTNHLPRIMAVRQKFPASPAVDVSATLRQQFVRVLSKVKPGALIAVAVGSRGITNLEAIVTTVVEILKTARAQPFIVPAMGSHGGATPEGQREILAEYGITEERLKVPIEAAMEVERLGVTEDGVDAYFSVAAQQAEGVIIVNRIKPHTDFGGVFGSGLLKMMVVGLGKRVGAANYHISASRLGYEHVLRSIARVTLRSAPILGGVAIIENQLHQTAKVALLTADEFEAEEAKLFVEAKALMPRLPFDDIDLLIVDRIGKNISGAGMDPNITGRWVHGYSSALGGKAQSGPVVRRLLVRELTPETHGNAIGIGLADVTTTRLVQAMDKRVTYINALTSLTPNSAKIPIHFDTDREAIAQALASLGLRDTSQARVVRIADTLSLEKLEVSEPYAELIRGRTDLEPINQPDEMKFDNADKLLPLT